MLRLCPADKDVPTHASFGIQIAHNRQITVGTRFEPLSFRFGLQFQSGCGLREQEIASLRQLVMGLVDHVAFRGIHKNLRFLSRVLQACDVELQQSPESFRAVKILQRPWYQDSLPPLDSAIDAANVPYRVVGPEPRHDEQQRTPQAYKVNEKEGTTPGKTSQLFQSVGDIKARGRLSLETCRSSWPTRPAAQLSDGGGLLITPGSRSLERRTSPTLLVWSHLCTVETNRDPLQTVATVSAAQMYTSSQAAGVTLKGLSASAMQSTVPCAHDAQSKLKPKHLYAGCGLVFKKRQPTSPSTSWSLVMSPVIIISLSFQASVRGMPGFGRWPEMAQYSRRLVEQDDKLRSNTARGVDHHDPSVCVSSLDTDHKIQAFNFWCHAAASNSYYAGDVDVKDV
ncbi:hypothetical protein FPHYL_526 [Fusarium phyllophilum]|uniref:Uncharacterized protein n=1 Tax=Fusarium phyllophilum TaxID=47803 RepID=A0A8H5KBQ8_9HYPO|nr:hypothetical protein FPHYL_526 [Fusarium phyllophilum]